MWSVTLCIAWWIQAPRYIYTIDVRTPLVHNPFMNKLVTIVETIPYAADAKNLLREEQRQDIAVMIAENPECGELMVGTGGCRKVRFAGQGKGKSGGFRIVYVYCGDLMPTFLFALFTKGQKSNLTRGERNVLAKVVKATKKNYGV